MNKQEQEIYAKMFRCEKLNANITPHACIKNQSMRPTSNLFFQRKLQIGNPCLDCKEGKARLPKDINIIAHEYKICELWALAPELCCGKEGGKFYREEFHNKELWNRKTHCNNDCYRGHYAINLKNKEKQGEING
jgi:hypothetical protein